MRAVPGAADVLREGLVEVKVVLHVGGDGRLESRGFGVLRLEDETQSRRGANDQIEADAMEVIVVTRVGCEVGGVDALEAAAKLGAGLEPGRK